MGRKLKCQWCKEKDEKDFMTKVSKESTSGVVKNQYFHSKNCYDSYLKDKEFKEKEKEEFQCLVETIEEMHGLNNIPVKFYPYIQDLRNGSVLFGKMRKKYKKGYAYSLIEDTYNYCKESIEWAKNNKDFDSTMQELKYCWAIVNDKIHVVKKIKEKKRKQIEEIDRSTTSIDNFVGDINYKNKNRTNERDISDFLDD